MAGHSSNLSPKPNLSVTPDLYLQTLWSGWVSQNRAPRLDPDTAREILACGPRLWRIKRAAQEKLKEWQKSNLATLNSRHREILITTPLRRRSLDPATVFAELARKSSGKAQREAVRRVLEESFAEWDRPARWVPAPFVDFSNDSPRARAELDHILWLASLAGLIERRRFDGEWYYTAVPEAWSALPDYLADEIPLMAGIAKGAHV